MQKVITTVDNVVRVSARTKERLEWISINIFGKMVQLKKGANIDCRSTSINLYENIDRLIPSSKNKDMKQVETALDRRNFVKTETGKGGKIDI